MKWIIFFILLQFIRYISYSQDTTELYKYYDGTRSFKLITKKDTTLIFIYPNGKRESIRLIKNNEITGTYSRWYENGKLMWKKELKNGIQNGKSEFYNQAGVKIAELFYVNGKISDTLFIKENTHLILGKITSSSKVYGGVEREDGSSNISEYSGPYSNCSMYAAEVDSIKKPRLIEYFKSDINGDFFIVVPEVKLDFFQKNIKIETLAPGEFHILENALSSGYEGWNTNGPIEVKKENKILLVELHYFFVGYAP